MTMHEVKLRGYYIRNNNERQWQCMHAWLVELVRENEKEMQN